MDISEVIRSRRAALGLSQAELAKKAGVSLRQLARYEAGDQQPVLSAAVALADALGISMDQLAGQGGRVASPGGRAPPASTPILWRCISGARCSSTTPSGPSRSPKAATAGE